jgi:putative N-acetylmannosamine-6-phosphate epimerase
MAFGMLPETGGGPSTRRVKAVSRHSVDGEALPNAPDLVAVARACESAGADALSSSTPLSAWRST